MASASVNFPSHRGIEMLGMLLNCSWKIIQRWRKGSESGSSQTVCDTRVDRTAARFWRRSSSLSTGVLASTKLSRIWSRLKLTSRQCRELCAEGLHRKWMQYPSPSLEASCSCSRFFNTTKYYAVHFWRLKPSAIHNWSSCRTASCASCNVFPHRKRCQHKFCDGWCHLLVGIFRSRPRRVVGVLEGREIARVEVRMLPWSIGNLGLAA